MAGPAAGYVLCGGLRLIIIHIHCKSMNFISLYIAYTYHCTHSADLSYHLIFLIAFFSCLPYIAILELYTNQCSFRPYTPYLAAITCISKD